MFSQKIRPGAFLLAFTSFIFLFMVFSLDLNHFAASGKDVFQNHEYWRLFLSTILHADLNHLAHNAFFFTGLAFILNGYFGFLSFPIISFLMGAHINLITLSFYPPETHLVGVSGVIYFMASYWLTLFVLIERRHPLHKRLIYAVGMALIFLFPETFNQETSYIAHAVGFISGIPLAGIYFGLNKKNIRAQEVWIEKLPEPPVDFDWENSDEYATPNKYE